MIRDKNNLTIAKSDFVRVQTVTDGPVTWGVILEADNSRCRDLNAVLVQFGNGTFQYMPGKTLEAVSRVTIEDSELGRVEGGVVGVNHEGYPLVSFNGNPSVVVFPQMVLSTRY